MQNLGHYKIIEQVLPNLPILQYFSALSPEHAFAKCIVYREPFDHLPGSFFLNKKIIEWTKLSYWFMRPILGASPTLVMSCPKFCIGSQCPNHIFHIHEILSN